VAEFGSAAYIVIRVQSIDWVERILQVAPGNVNKIKKTKESINEGHLLNLGSNHYFIVVIISISNIIYLLYCVRIYTV